MEKVWQKFSSFEEADRAEDVYYKSLSPDERVALLLEIIRQYTGALDGTEQGFERVFRVVALEES